MELLCSLVGWIDYQTAVAGNQADVVDSQTAVVGSQADVVGSQAAVVGSQAAVADAVGS